MISKYVVTRSMFKNVLCGVNVQCVHVLCKRLRSKTNFLVLVLVLSVPVLVDVDGKKTKKQYANGGHIRLRISVSARPLRQCSAVNFD